MANVPELQSEAVKWQRRISMMASSGLDTAPVTQLAKTDLSRIIQGGSPLAENEIISMVHSAYTGQVTTPQAKKGPDWNPLHVIGNIGKDLTTDVRSFVPGLVHEGADIINPSKWAQVPEHLSAATSDLFSGNITDAAKDIVTAPVIGSLVPGAFAISGGWSGLTEHPLNDFLSVLPIAATGSKLMTLGASEAEAGTALAALKEGHPFQALARKSGLEERLTQAIKNSSGATGQYAYMPVWRAYNELARVYARRFATEALTELKGAGLIGKGLSHEDSQRLVVDAQSYNPRYENKPVEVPAAQIAASQGDATAAFGSVPPGRDVVAYAVTPNPDFMAHTSGTVSATPLMDHSVVYFDPKQAVASLGEDLAPYAKDFVHEVRVSPQDIAFDHGVWVGHNLYPNRTYKPGEGAQLQSIRDFSEKWQGKSLRPTKNVLTREEKQAPNVILPNPITGKPEVYARKSEVYKTYEKSGVAARDVTRAANRVESARAQIEQAENIAAGRTETYARYGEPAEAAAKRPPTVPAIESLYEVAQDYIIQGMYGPKRTLYENLDAAFQLKSPRKIKSALTAMKRELGRGGSEFAAQLSYAKYLYESTTSLGVRSELAATGVRKLQIAKRTFDNAQRELVGAKRAAAASSKAFYDSLTENPPDRFFPLIHEQARGHLVRDATSEFMQNVAAKKNEIQGAALGEAIAQMREEYQRLVTRITDAHSREELSSFVDPKTLERVEKNAFQDWVQMAKAGYDPIWTHELSYQHYDNMTFGEIRPLPTRIMNPASARAKIFDFSPQVLDIGAVLTAHAVDYLQTEASRQFVEFLVNKSGTVHSVADVTADLEKRYGKNNPHIETELRNNYTPFDPHAFIPSWKGPKDQTYIIPKTVDNGFKMLLEGDKLPLKAIRQPVHRVFKVAVLTGPRHMVHVGLGGLVMTAVREPGAIPELLAHPVAVFKLARDGKIPDEVSRLGIPKNIKDTLSKGMYEERIDQIIGLRSGMKLGEWFRQSKIGQGLHSTEQHINDLENTVTDMYRASTYLHQMKNGATNEQALAIVNKTLLNVDNLTPFERTVVRQVFPFWTFTKHILQYVLTYPADHPLRASILASLASQMETENASGDPGRLSKLFFLGEPDVNGKVQTVDMSNLNPFRSMSSVFSMSGFLMGLAPELQVGLRSLGINPLSGTTSMHQNYSYDAYAGTNLATRPKMNPFDFASAFIPQVEILDHFLLFTDSIRQLKKSNPEAYQRILYQEMNLPFAVAPINIYDVRAKAAAAQFRGAQQAVSNAMVTGDTKPIRSFDAVPFQGYLYPADQVANYIENFDQLFPGIAPKAVETHKTVKRKKGQP